MNDNSIIQMLVSGQGDLLWFETHLEELKEKYNNQFVAIHQNKVIESDSNLDNLLKKLKDIGIDASKILIEFISRIKAVL